MTATVRTDVGRMSIDCEECGLHIEITNTAPVSRERMLAAGQAHDLFHHLADGMNRQTMQ
jgi:hypothetical protein